MAFTMSCGRTALPCTRKACQPSSITRLQPRLVATRRPATALRKVVRAGLGQYLSEAAAAIFSLQESDVPWGESGFSGEITHHGEVQKLRQLHSLVKSTRQQLAGCIDPTASNYDPNAVVDDGTCEYIVQEPGQKEFKGSIGSYIGEALSSVMGSANDSGSKKGSGKQANFENTVYSYGGKSVSQRDITRLLSFERVVKKELDKAEASGIEEA